jgi:hypothetical protein
MVFEFPYAVVPQKGGVRRVIRLHCFGEIETLTQGCIIGVGTIRTQLYFMSGAIIDYPNLCA